MSKNQIGDLIRVSITNEIKHSYLDYAMSVITDRAIPDVRDGLKPVQRRILYVMHESGYLAHKPHKKSARIVGDTTGKYHPHGELAIYGALARMAQAFSLRHPLVDGQGNFGSIDGDSPAAMRYTEGRLEKIAHKLLEDIDKDAVNFVPNYDGSESEPTVLPGMFPNLLINGAGGIAVGMATNIPPHNLAEVLDACCAYIDNEHIDISELIKIVQAPDFPTGGTILRTDGVRSAYETGRGSIVIRGQTEIETESNQAQAIIIKEIPYLVNKAKLVERIAELVREKKIEGVSDLRDESNKEGIRVVIELKKGVIAETILSQLYSYTQLQTTFGVIMLALDHGTPKVMNLKEVISAFISFREEVITRRTIFLLNQNRDRAHVLLAIRIAVNSIDEVIRIIRASVNAQEAKKALLEKAWDCKAIKDLINLVDDKIIIHDDGTVYLTEIQVKSILEVRLQRLTALEKGKIEDDLKEIAQRISGYIEILSNREQLLSVLKQELLEIKRDFGAPRLTSIIDGKFDHDMEALIPREEMVVTMTHDGYIKRVPLAGYRAQHRGGKGRSGSTMREDDVITEMFVGNTHTPLLCFSDHGQVYSTKLHKLPLGTAQTKGRPIINIFPLKSDERINSVMPLPEDQTEWERLSVLFATMTGQVRRNDLLDFRKIQSNGKIAIRLDEGDRLVNVKVCCDDDHVFLATKRGKAIRFPVNVLRVFKSRTSDGVRGIKLTNDCVISMTILKGKESTIDEREAYLLIPLETRLKIASVCKSGDQASIDALEFSSYCSEITRESVLEMACNEEFILTVTQKGYGKRSSAFQYRTTNRGGTGIVNMLTNKKTGEVVAAMPVSMNDELMMITNQGQLIRCKLDSVRVTGRGTSGVILFKTSDKEHVVSASLIHENKEMNSEFDQEPEN